MFTSRSIRKIARLSLTTATAGAALAIVFLGGPADASTFSRGLG